MLVSVVSMAQNKPKAMTSVPVSEVTSTTSALYYNYYTGAQLVVPGILSCYNDKPSLYWQPCSYSNTSGTISLYPSVSEEFVNLDQIYDHWVNFYAQGKNITYKRLTPNFAVVSFWDGDTGNYLRAEYGKNKIHIWHLKWVRSSHDTAKSILDNGQVKFIF